MNTHINTQMGQTVKQYQLIAYNGTPYIGKAKLALVRKQFIP